MRIIRLSNYSPMEESAIDQLMNVHFAFAQVVRKHIFCMPEQKSVNLHQLHALMVIQDHPFLTMTEFARRMQIGSSTATALVDRLCKSGMADRVRDPANRKIVRLQLTPAARASIDRLMREKQAMFRPLFEQISPADQRALIRILQALIDSSRSSHDS